MTPSPITLPPGFKIISNEAAYTPPTSKVATSLPATDEAHLTDASGESAGPGNHFSDIIADAIKNGPTRMMDFLSGHPYEDLKKHAGEMADKAKAAFKAGDTSTGIGYLTAAFLPGSGDEAVASGEEFGAGNPSGGLGHMVLALAPFLAGPIAEKVAPYAGAAAEGVKAAAPDMATGAGKLAVAEPLAHVPGVGPFARVGLQYPALRQMRGGVSKGMGAFKAALDDARPIGPPAISPEVTPPGFNAASGSTAGPIPTGYQVSPGIQPPVAGTLPGTVFPEAETQPSIPGFDAATGSTAAPIPPSAPSLLRSQPPVSGALPGQFRAVAPAEVSAPTTAGPTLDEIAQSQSGKPFAKLNATEQQSVLSIHSRLAAANQSAPSASTGLPKIGDEIEIRQPGIGPFDTSVWTKGKVAELRKNPIPGMEGDVLPVIERGQVGTDWRYPSSTNSRPAPVVGPPAPPVAPTSASIAASLADLMPEFDVRKGAGQPASEAAPVPQAPLDVGMRSLPANVRKAAADANYRAQQTTGEGVPGGQAYEAAGRANKVDPLVENLAGRLQQEGISAADAGILSNPQFKPHWAALAHDLGIKEPSPTTIKQVIEELQKREAVAK